MSDRVSGYWYFVIVLAVFFCVVLGSITTCNCRESLDYKMAEKFVKKTLGRKVQCEVAGVKDFVYPVYLFKFGKREVYFSHDYISKDQEAAKADLKKIYEILERYPAISRAKISYRVGEIYRFLWVGDFYLKVGEGWKKFAEDTPGGLAKTIKQCGLRLQVGDGLKRLKTFAEGRGYGVVVKGRGVEVKLKEKEVASFLNKLARHNIKYSEISIDKPTLEDYFLAQSREER